MTRLSKQINDNASTTRRSILAAAVTMVALLVASGAAYRVLGGYLDRSDDSVPLPPGALDKLPLKIGAWEGRDSPLSEAIVKATDTDALINRAYARQAESVGLFVAYGVKARDLMPHRPEVCYPGAGWTLDDTRDMELSVSDGFKLKCRILRFSRSGMATQNITVLNYYIVNGDYCPDVSLLRSKAWHGSGSIRFMAQVQITSSGSTDLSADLAARSVRAFAIDSAVPIYKLFPDTGKDPGEDIAQTNPASKPRGAAND